METLRADAMAAWVREHLVGGCGARVWVWRRPPAPYEQFVAFMKRLIAVPKSEGDNASRP